MNGCDDLLEAALLGRPLDPRQRAHADACPRCRHEMPVLERAGRLLAAPPAPPVPSAGLTRTVLAAAEPLLAARRTIDAARYRRALGYAILAALAPLPLVLALDAYVVRAAHFFLSAILPDVLSTYLTFNLGALMVLALTLGYGAVPVLVHRQLRPAGSG